MRSSAASVSDALVLGVADRPLMPAHEELIRASAIDPEVARERGYFSAMRERHLDAIGLPRYVSTWVESGCGCAGPGPLTWGKAPLSQGLAFLVRHVDGEIAFYMLRPDRPRVDRNFKPVKYERPPASRNVLDIHPRVRDRLLDTDVPLYITEGSRKVDAAVSAGLCCIGALGVWRGDAEMTKGSQLRSMTSEQSLSTAAKLRLSSIQM